MELKKELQEILNILEDGKPLPVKYKEDKIIGEAFQHILSTYAGHYVRKGKQTLDVFADMSEEYPRIYCLTNAIKYLTRYGKKEGRNKKDLLKAIHCIVLLIYFDHYYNE